VAAVSSSSFCEDGDFFEGDGFLTGAAAAFPPFSLEIAARLLSASCRAFSLPAADEELVVVAVVADVVSSSVE